MFNLPSQTDGPERFRGGRSCIDHHNGVREGISDWCCCCNPCLYVRNPVGQAVLPNSPWEVRGLCCKCHPIAICMIFTPEGSNSACCREMAYPAFVEFAADLFVAARYTFSFNLQTITLSIEGSLDAYNEVSYLLGPCRWHLESTGLAVDEEQVIDHVNITCLQPPSWMISGVTDSGGCTGTLSFFAYEAAKVPFQNTGEHISDDIVVPYPACNCNTVARILCVIGDRHGDGVEESVQFVWDEDLGDRWAYLPPCGDPSTDRELIYLRGDVYGNCHLELDFEQSGGDTNDWADPPNTYDAGDPYAVRDGLIEIPGCGTCGFKVQSESTGGRHVTITSGPCSRWRYLCGTCRCVPQTLCVFGEIDGHTINNILFDWDATLLRWVGDVPGLGEIRLGLTGGPECDDPSRGSQDGCTGMTDNVAYPYGTPHDISMVSTGTSVTCPFVNFELASEYDPTHPERFNWLWASSGFCGCAPQVCFICSDERCGGPPPSLQLDLIGNCYADPAFPGSFDSTCTLSMTVYYWQRYTHVADSPPVLECGYAGYKIVSCPTTTYLISAYSGGSSQIFLTRTDLNTGISIELPLSGTTISPSSCDPFVFESAVSNVGSSCLWNCNEPVTGRGWEAYISLVE